MFPLTLVVSDDIVQRLNYYKVPTISEWDHDLGVAWFIPREVIKKIQKDYSQNNSLFEFEIDINKSILTTNSLSLNLEIKDSSKKMFLSGEWDATSTLLENIELVIKKIGNLPYIKFNKIN